TGGGRVKDPLEGNSTRKRVGLTRGVAGRARQKAKPANRIAAPAIPQAIHLLPPDRAGASPRSAPGASSAANPSAAPTSAADCQRWSGSRARQRRTVRSRSGGVIGWGGWMGGGGGGMVVVSVGGGG